MAAMATGAHSFGPMPMTENVSKEFLVSVLECIRSVLLSTKNGKGLSPKQIIYDYMYLVGEPVPFEKLGYSDLAALLDAHHEVCTRKVENGSLVYYPVINERCEHMWRLINNQKPQRRPRSKKRKSTSINEDSVPHKRSKSDPRHVSQSSSFINDAIDDAPTPANTPVSSAKSAVAANEIKITPPALTNKAVHWDAMVAAKQRPQRQRSRTRLPFFHRDDPSKPKFKTHPRRRGRSMSSFATTALTGDDDFRNGKKGAVAAIFVPDFSVNGAGTSCHCRCGGYRQVMGNGWTNVGKLRDDLTVVLSAAETREIDGMNDDNHNDNNGNNSPFPHQGDSTPVNMEISVHDDQRTPTNRNYGDTRSASANDPTPTNVANLSRGNSSSASSSASKFKAPHRFPRNNHQQQQQRKSFYPGRTSTPRRPFTDYPVPADIRKNILKILQDFPKGIFIHEIPDLYRRKLEKQMPQFLTTPHALEEVLYCFSDDVRVVKHDCGSVTVKLIQYDKRSLSSFCGTSSNSSQESQDLSSQSSTAEEAKARVVDTLTRLLARRLKCGMFLSRLRVEFFKESGEMIPFKSLGFRSERSFLASMPDKFSLRPSTTQPVADPEYIVSLAVSGSVGNGDNGDGPLGDESCIGCRDLEK